MVGAHRIQEQPDRGQYGNPQISHENILFILGPMPRRC
jgi:hypothetical protein